jgi:hypothetical protein
MPLRTRLVAIPLLVGLAASCSSAPAEDTSPVVFGNGTIPSTVPKDFPIPPGAVVGDTMIDRPNHTTEFGLQVGQDLETVAQFFDIELVSSGYVVTSSGSVSADMWRLSFIQGELRGDVTISSTGGGVAEVIVTLNVA